MGKPGSTRIDEFVRLAIIGDGAAFTHLWDEHINALKIYLRATFKQLDDFFIDDVCSRSFEKAFRQIKTYDPSKSQFGTWLRTISRNTALDILEGESHLQRTYLSIEEGIPAIETLGTGDESPLESIIRGEDRDITRTCIEGLPELYREVASLRLLDGMQYKEIADELDMELNTVRTRIRRAKGLIEKMKKDNAVQEG